MATEKLAKLKKKIAKNGFEYTQVARSDKAAVYEGRNSKFPEDTSLFYEVFRIKHAKGYTLYGKSGPTKGKAYNYPPSERFPSNESFGQWAWTFNSKEKAMEKFDELNKAED